MVKNILKKLNDEKLSKSEEAIEVLRLGRYENEGASKTDKGDPEFTTGTGRTTTEDVEA